LTLNAKAFTSAKLELGVDGFFQIRILMVLQPAFFKVVIAFSATPFFLKMVPSLSIKGKYDISAARIKSSVPGLFGIGAGVTTASLEEQENKNNPITIRANLTNDFISYIFSNLKLVF
jgi:hypothetical protein